MNARGIILDLICIGKIILIRNFTVLKKIEVHCISFIEI